MTTPTPAPVAEKLTAEREAALRAWAGHWPWPDAPETRWWRRDVAQLFATLDASRAETEAAKRTAETAMVAAAKALDGRDQARAETEAVRRERDAMETSRDGWWKQAKAHNRAQKELKALAAELVEGLARFGKHADSYAPQEDDAFQVWKDATEVLITVGDLRTAHALAARARAQGIGGEKEKGNG